MALGTINIGLDALRTELQYGSNTNTSLNDITDNAVNTSSEIFSGSFHNYNMTNGFFADAIASPFQAGQGATLDWRNYNHNEVFYQVVGLDLSSTTHDVNIEMWLYDGSFNQSSIFSGFVTAGNMQDFGGSGGPTMYTHGDYYIGFTVSIIPSGYRNPVIIDVTSAVDVWDGLGASCTLAAANGFNGWNLNPDAGGTDFQDIAFVDPNNVVNPDWIPWNRAPRIDIRVIDL